MNLITNEMVMEKLAQGRVIPTSARLRQLGVSKDTSRGRVIETRSPGQSQEPVDINAYMAAFNAKRNNRANAAAAAEVYNRPGAAGTPTPSYLTAGKTPKPVAPAPPPAARKYGFQKALELSQGGPRSAGPRMSVGISGGYGR